MKKPKSTNINSGFHKGNNRIDGIINSKPKTNHNTVFTCNLTQFTSIN